MSKITQPHSNLSPQNNSDNSPDGKAIQSKIAALPDTVIDQIAAGEVLERPAHMLKELMENSLDAGATSIEIHVKNGGRDLKIKDNGVGMYATDLKLAILRHTTSKLKKVQDLWGLKTFGFRGEALASVAAVSRLRICSKQKGREAVEIQSHFGRLQDQVEARHEVGTSVEVESLFENVPARKKFLKTDAYETSEIRKVVSAYGLSSPATEIKFFCNGQLEFFWPGNSDIISRYKEILKVKDLYSLTQNYGDIEVKAFFAPPHETAKSTRKIWLLVQNRWVVEPSLLAAIRDGFQNALLPGESPIGALFVNVPTEAIDVNVHPTKSRIKFQDPSSIYRAVRNTLLELVEQSPWRQDFLKTPWSSEVSQTPTSMEVRSSAMTYQPVQQMVESSQAEQYGFGIKAYRQSHSQAELQDSKVAMENPMTSAMTQQEEGFTAVPAKTTTAAKVSVDHALWSNLKVIGQVAKTYIVTQNQTEMILIDQHAAHERFLFEKLWTSFKADHSLETQNHLLPLSYTVEEESHMELLLTEKKQLEKLGIIFEQSGPTQIEIVATPVLFKEKAIIKTLDIMLEQLNKNGSSFVFEDAVADMFATMACHSAIRAGQILNQAEMESLLDCLDEYPTTSYCPHGRPVFVRYPFSQLETDFFRRV